VNSLHIAVMLVRQMLWRKWSFLGYMLLPALVVSLAAGIISSSGGSTKIRLEAVNQDEGPLAALMLNDWSTQSQFDIHQSDSTAEASGRVLEHLADTSVIFPADFSKNVLDGHPSGLEINQPHFSEALYLTDPAARALLGQLTDTAAHLRSTGINRSEELLSRIEAVYRDKLEHGAVPARLNPLNTTNERITITTGLLLLFILILSSSTMSVIADERKNHTLQRMYASPLRSVEITAGHFLGCFLLGTLQISFVLAIINLVMKVEMGPTLLYQWLVLECFLLAALGIVSAIVAVAQNAETSGALNIVVITPTCMIGGCFWSLSIMPESMQKLANFVPQKWAVEAVTMLAEGAELSDVKLHLGILLLFGVVLLSFGTTASKPGDDTFI
jgi:ABC-2 type transport system permease protein